MTFRNKRSIVSWCFYDWGLSAFASVIITFVYAVYFGRGIVGDETLGAAKWSFAIAVSGGLIALTSPVLGAVADYFGACKPWIILFTALNAAATALLYFGMPHGSAGNIFLVLSLLVLANVAHEMAQVFNNALMPHLAPADRIGRISGWAWGMGYAGGMTCLVLSLVLLVGIGKQAPLLPLPTGQSENIRAVGPLVAVWMMVFMMPLLAFTKDVPRSAMSLGQAVVHGLRQLKETVQTVGRRGNILKFLVASALYRDGLNTLFAMGGIYAAGTFGMGFQDILIFAIGLNVAAAIGSAGFAFLDDARGSKVTILISLIGLLLTGCAVLLAQDKVMFTGIAMVMGLFIGPVQAASRTMAARISAPEHVGQTFGLYALTGRVASFFGPAAYGVAVLVFSTQRAGMATILLFWLAGLVILWGVKENQRDQ
ncbi:MAG: putative transporter [Micavibrio sp.]|nr:putative transporter [Micavibrio sp.]